jgi:hypothetical protein
MFLKNEQGMIDNVRQIGVNFVPFIILDKYLFKSVIFQILGERK